MSILKLAVLWILFLIVAAFISPPDLISQITIAVMMAVIYGLLTFIISRSKSLAQTPADIRKLIAVLVILLSVSFSLSLIFVIAPLIFRLLQ